MVAPLIPAIVFGGGLASLAGFRIFQKPKSGTVTIAKPGNDVSIPPLVTYGLLAAGSYYAYKALK